MKKPAVLFIIVTLCIGLAVPAAAAGSVFSDVPANHWACAAIEDMAARGVVQGVGGGRFDPGSRVNSTKPVPVSTLLLITVSSNTLFLLPESKSRSDVSRPVYVSENPV